MLIGCATIYLASACADDTMARIVNMLLPPCLQPCKSQDGTTPLHNATSSGHADCVQLLIEKGADVDAEDTVRPHPNVINSRMICKCTHAGALR